MLSSSKVFKFIKEYLIMTFGMLLYSFSWVQIVVAAKGVGGGISGLCLLIYYATDGAIPIGISVLVINAILVVIGGMIIGWNFGVKTIYCIIVSAIAMSLFQQCLPPDFLGLGSDRFLSIILAGVMVGVGVGLSFSQGGSTGGVDIIAMIINKYRTVSYSRVVFVSDTIVIGLSYFIFQDITTIIYGFVLLATFGYTVDMMVAGGRQSSQIFIISPKYNEIRDKIFQEVKRGVTFIDAQGGYSHQPIKVIMVVCRKDETNVLYRVIRECDPEAFITVGYVMGVYGEGFERLKK